MGAKRLFKKHACYLSICLLVAPLVATAEDLLVVSPAPVQLALSQLSTVCPGLAGQVDAPSQARLQAFYQQQGDVVLWSEGDRRAELQAQLQLLADDGLDPAHYRLPPTDATGNVLCIDIGTSQQYLQALQDLHFGRLQQSRFEPVWHSQPAPDSDTQVLAMAEAGMQNGDPPLPISIPLHQVCPDGIS